jgi:hypothetical protein
VVSSTKVNQRATVPALPVKLPTTSTTVSNPNPCVGEECRKANLDTAVGEDARSLDLKAARILPKVVAATWGVHQLRETPHGIEGAWLL